MAQIQIPTRGAAALLGGTQPQAKAGPPSGAAFARTLDDMTRPPEKSADVFLEGAAPEDETIATAPVEAENESDPSVDVEADEPSEPADAVTDAFLDIFGDGETAGAEPEMEAGDAFVDAVSVEAPLLPGASEATAPLASAVTASPVTTQGDESPLDANRQRDRGTDGPAGGSAGKADASPLPTLATASGRPEAARMITAATNVGTETFWTWRPEPSSEQTSLGIEAADLTTGGPRQTSEARLAAYPTLLPAQPPIVPQAAVPGLRPVAWTRSGTGSERETTAPAPHALPEILPERIPMSRGNRGVEFSLPDRLAPRLSSGIPSVPPLSAAQILDPAWGPGNRTESAALEMLSPSGSPIGASSMATAQATSLAAGIGHAGLAQPTVRQVSEAARALGDRPVEIILSPQELGRVRMHLSVAETGLTLTIAVDRDETLQLLRRNADLLMGDLRDLGYDGVDLSFRRGDQGHGAGTEGGRAQTSGKADAATAEEPKVGSRSAPHGRGGLDLRL